MKLHARKVNPYKQPYPRSLLFDLKEQLESFPKPDIQNKSSSKFKSIFGFIMLAACSITLAVLAYNAFKYAKHPTTIDEIPLIKADHTAVKTIPSDPGGQQVLNQDKLVYNNLLDPNLKITKKYTNKIEDDSANTDVHLRAPKHTERSKAKVENKPASSFDYAEAQQKSSASQNHDVLSKDSSMQPKSPASEIMLTEKRNSKLTQQPETKKMQNPFDVLDATDARKPH
jgi:hypothetical protein